MTALLFANLARDRGLSVERQFDTWEGGRFGVQPHGDVISELRFGAREGWLGWGPRARSSAG